MRFINTEEKRPPEDWCIKAENHTRELKKINSCEERVNYIDKHSGVWRELKNWLQELSHNKCWYSESIEKYSHYEVEHFRPKNKVIRFNGIVEEGYWWLAFDWTNYRLCGNVGNRRKGVHFPIKEGSLVVTNPNWDLCDELTYLLDPTNPDDPALLTFDESGQIIPATSEGTWEYERAKVTIELFYLNFPRLKDGRVMTWNKCFGKIIEAEKLMQKQSKSPSVTNRENIKAIFKELREMTLETAEFSATSRACLLSSGRTWARNLVN